MVFDLPPRVEDDPRADERKLFASIVTPGVTISGCRLAIYASGRGQQGWCPQSFSFRCCSKSAICSSGVRSFACVWPGFADPGPAAAGFSAAGSGRCRSFGFGSVAIPPTYHPKGSLSRPERLFLGPTAGPVEKQASLDGPSGVRDQCGRYARYTATEPTKAPATWAAIYPGTCAQENRPIAASERVKAGLRCAPLKGAAVYAPTFTAIAQPKPIMIHPEELPLVRERTTFATTPLPRRMSNAVPTISAM